MMVSVETFVVRIWATSDLQPSHDGIRGFVLNVRSGEESSFTGASALLAILGSPRATMEQAVAADTDE